MTIIYLFKAFLFTIFCSEIKPFSSVEEKIFVTSINCAIESQSGSSIRVGGKEYSKQKDGLNVVVYDLNKFHVISTRSFGQQNEQTYIRFYKKIPFGTLVIVTSQLLCSRRSSVDLDVQKSILLGMGLFGFKVFGDTTPVDLRSTAYIFCKGSCLHNVTSSIALPFKALRDFTEDPVMISFRLTKREIVGITAFLIENKILAACHDQLDLLIIIGEPQAQSKTNSKSTLLYIVIGCCSVFILISMVTTIIFYLRRRRIRKRNFQHKGKCGKHNGQLQCACTYYSTENYSEQFSPTTSAKLFSKHKCNSINTTFATYVRVQSNEHHQLYKIPSGVSKHEPPVYPPSIRPPPYKSSCSTINESYITPHDYANPPENEMEQKSEDYEISEEQTNFIDSTLMDLAEYTSLEPYLKDEYMVP